MTGLLPQHMLGSFASARLRTPTSGLERHYWRRRRSRCHPLGSSSSRWLHFSWLLWCCSSRNGELRLRMPGPASKEVGINRRPLMPS